MERDPRLRASDADRDRVAEALRDHHAAGRLTLEEFQERLDVAYRAKTLGELDALMTDLPELDLYELPVPAERHAYPAAGRRGGHPALSARRAAWASWASISAICFVVWLVTVVVGGHGITPWWLWVAGPWGALLLARSLSGGSPSARRRRAERLRARDMRRELRERRGGGGRGLPG